MPLRWLSRSMVALSLAALGCGTGAARISAPRAEYPSDAPSKEHPGVPAWLATEQAWEVGDWSEWADDLGFVKHEKGRSRLTLLSRTGARELWESKIWKGDAPFVRVFLVSRDGGSPRLARAWVGVEGALALEAPDAWSAAGDPFREVRDGWDFARSNRLFPKPSKDVDAIELAPDDVEVAGRKLRALRVLATKTMGPARARVFVWFVPDVPGRVVRLKGEGDILRATLVHMESKLLAYGHEGAPRPSLRLPPEVWPPRQPATSLPER